MKELTLKEVVQILDSIRSEHQQENEAGLSEIALTSYAYAKGYEAAMNDRKIYLEEFKNKTAAIEEECKKLCESAYEYLAPFIVEESEV